MLAATLEWPAEPIGQFVVECAALAYAPPDKREPPEWAGEHIRAIPNSARGTKRFNRSTYPMMNEPLCRSVDPAVRRLVVMAPTGGGKTTLVDVSTPYVLVNSLGSILMTIQGKGKADEYCQERLWPLLDACQPVVDMKPTGPKSRHLIKKDSRVYPGGSLFVDGDNKNAAQRRSVTFVRLDEAWLIKYGLIREFEARLHDRWNGQITLISQGGEQVVPEQKIELEEYWLTTDQAELHFRCPVCTHVQPYLWDSEAKRYSLRYDQITHADGSLDHNATAATARIVCANPACEAALPDTLETRRQLVESLDGDPRQYIATATPKKPGYCGRHFNVLAMWWVEWRDVVLEWLAALDAYKDGDRSLMVTFVTKRLARTYLLPKQEAKVSLTAANYTLAEYFTGRGQAARKLDGETHRFMGVDVQLDHFWVLIRAFRADASSRLLYAAKVETVEMVREIQVGMGVDPRLTFLDYNYVPTQVGNYCARYDWTAVEGDKAPGFLWPSETRTQRVVRPYSQIQDVACNVPQLNPYLENPDPNNPDHYVRFFRRMMFSRVAITDEAVRLRDGAGPKWEHGTDTSEHWQKHVVSEYKTEAKGEGGKPTFMYKRYKQRRNDLWWGEVAVTLGAIYHGILRPAALNAEETQPSVDTSAVSVGSTSLV